MLITGPSGAWKTTLLSLIWGLILPQSWNILYHLDMSLRDRLFWYAFIDGPFFENLSMKENILFLENFLSIQIDREYYQYLIQYFEIDTLEDTRVISLSSGQRERVNFVRALVHHPSVVILDEPGANLDNRLFLKLYNFIEKHSEDRDTTFAMVSHDPRFASVATKHIEL